MSTRKRKHKDVRDGSGRFLSGMAVFVMIIGHLISYLMYERSPKIVLLGRRTLAR